MVKRILTLFLVFSLLICPDTVLITEAGGIDVKALAEENKENTEAIQLLYALGIISVKEDVAGFVTRQQFVDYAATMIKLNSTSDEKIFDDTDVGSVAHTFAKMNFLKVSADKKFRPSDDITYGEACIILTRVLGYEEYVSARGGSISEYMKCAKMLDISIGKSIKERITFADMAELLKDALNAQIYEIVSLGKHGAEYSQTDTLMKSVFDVSVKKGVFNANEWTSAYRDVESPGKGKVIIDNTVLDAKDSEYAESMLLGRHVKAYVKGMENDALPKVLLVIPDDKNTEIYSFSSTDFLGVDGNKIKFYSDNKEKTVLLNYPTLIYNGETDFDAGRSEIIKLFGNYNTKITVVRDKDADSNAIVFVNEYINAEVSSVDENAGYIYAKDVSKTVHSIPACEEKTDQKVLIRNLESGDKEALNDISRGAIISFMISKSGKVVTIYHATKSVQGTIQSLSENGNDRFAEIDGEKYKASEKVLCEALKLNMSATFYFGIENEIIAANGGTDSWQTGYIYHIGTVNKRLESVKYKFKVFTTDGTVKVFTCADKFTLDGLRKSDDRAFYERIAPDGIIDDRLRLFRYKLNAKDEIKYIDTAALLGETPEEEKSLRILGEKLSRTFRKDTNSGYMMFEANTSVSGTVITPKSGENRIYPYPVNNNTDIFSVPHTDGFEAIDRNFSYLKLGKSSNLLKDKNFTCAFYNTDANSEYVSIILNYRQPMEDYIEKSNPYLINNVGIRAINEDGDVCRGIEVITTVAVTSAKLTSTVLLNSTVEFTDVRGQKTVMSDEEVIAALSPGDVIQYGNSVSSCTRSIRVLYDYDADDPDTADDDNRGQVYWGWIDENGDSLPTYTYRYTSGKSDTNLSVDLTGVYGYILDSAIDADTQAQEDSYGRTAPSCYVFLGAAGTEGTDIIHGSAGWATGYRRLTIFDNYRRKNKAYWGIFTDLVNYRSSNTDYYYALLFNGLTNQQGNCAVFYKR